MLKTVTLLASAALLAQAASPGPFPTFDDWASAHNKVYATSAERAYRRAVYTATVSRHRARNAEEGAQGAQYATLRDRDSDRTAQELLQTRNGCFASAPVAPSDPRRVPAFTDSELRDASNVDWRAAGGVTAVQQQHPFGTCWAFSLVAVAEGAMVAQGGKKLVKLSEQNVVSCVPQDDCAQTADQTVPGLQGVTAGRLQLEVDYPYNRTCNFVREEVLAPDGTRDGYNGTCNDSVPLLHGHCTPCPGISRIDGTPPCKISNASAGTKYSEGRLADWGFVPTGDSDAPMVAALRKFGPMQIAINTACLHGYAGGIISNCSSSGNQGHAVTIVGAGMDEGSKQTYWVVKNSWGTEFGEAGFYRVARAPVQMSLEGAYIGCYDKGCYAR